MLKKISRFNIKRWLRLKKHIKKTYVDYFPEVVLRKQISLRFSRISRSLYRSNFVNNLEFKRNLRTSLKKWPEKVTFFKYISSIEKYQNNSRNSRNSGIFIVNFEHILNLVLVILLLIFNM